jgi:hypothetical protein
MKKLLFALLFVTLCSTQVFSLSLNSTNKVQDDLEDKIELSRQGGTTRATDINTMRMMSVADPVVVDAYFSRNTVTVSVENYRGGAWIEITGPGGSRSSYIEVYDMGFDAIHLSGLRAGSYNIRITLDSGVYSGTFKKGQHGRK